MPLGKRVDRGAEARNAKRRDLRCAGRTYWQSSLCCSWQAAARSKRRTWRFQVPEWTRTGNFTFARWDGGPLGVAKGTLSD